VTTNRRAAGFSFAAGLLLIIVARTSVAAPPSAKPPAGGAKAACVAAHEQAQTLRTQKKPHAARTQYVACARAECPVVLRKECSDQLEQIDQTAPTATLEALDEKGNSDSAVKVSLDGLVITDKLTGAAVPGEHVFRFERASDGKVIEQKVLVVEGERNRKVVADYQTLLPKKPTPEGGGGSAKSESPKSIPTLAYATGGAAVLGLAGFVIFSLSGKSKEDDLAGKCAPRCTDEDVSPVKTNYLIGDVSLGIGIIAAVVTAVLIIPTLTTSSPAPKTASAIWLPKVTSHR
jgi:hypothetical protein